MKSIIRCERGSATVEFVALALPLFVPIIFFLHQFASVSGQGDLSRTNLVTPGQLSSDQTFLTFAVRHELTFFKANNVGIQGATAPSLQNVQELSIWVLANSSYQYKVSEKVSHV